MTGLTVEELAARQWRPVWYVAEILADERERGHVELVGGRWEATPGLVERYAGAFGCLTAPMLKPTRGVNRS
jgi:hypothetical protein